MPGTCLRSPRRSTVLPLLDCIRPPGFGNAAAIARLFRRMREHVPIGEPVGRLVPMRDPIAAGAQYAVKRTASNHQIWAGFCLDYALDQCIHDGVGNPREIM